MSGSRGAANFVWRCKNCKVFELVLRTRSGRHDLTAYLAEGVIGIHPGCRDSVRANRAGQAEKDTPV